MDNHSNGAKLIERIIKKEFVLVAEIGVNYYDIAKKMNTSPLDAAKLMIKEAKDAGVHVVKFQTYKADTLASKYSPSYWDTTEEANTSQYELFKQFDSFNEKEYMELAEFCNLLNVAFLSTAFDFNSADFLEPLMPVYKISSSDLSNLPFIAYQAKKQKPIMISCGASDLNEIKQALHTIRTYNQEPIVLLHCVLEYPTPYSHTNLNKIISLNKEFPELIIGYSDHSKPDVSLDVIKTAYNLGATVIEKHFTLDKTLKGNDHYHAMDTDDVRKIVAGIDFINKIRGSYDIMCLDTEQTARLNARRSIIANTYIEQGKVITEEMVTFKRPGTGISPSELSQVIGKTAIQDIKEDTILQWNLLQ
jgi:N-acetylneuraminate synthase